MLYKGIMNVSVCVAYLSNLHLTEDISAPILLIQYRRKAVPSVDLQHYQQWPNTSRDIKRKAITVPLEQEITWYISTIWKSYSVSISYAFIPVCQVVAYLAGTGTAHAELSEMREVSHYANQ